MINMIENINVLIKCKNIFLHIMIKIFVSFKAKDKLENIVQYPWKTDKNKNML